MSAAIAILIFEQSYGGGKDSERCSSPDAYAAAASGATGVKVTETKSGVKFEIIRDNRKKEDDKK